MLQGLGMLWTLPNTALGLAAGAIGIAFGASCHRSMAVSRSSPNNPAT